jgi:capsid protein
MTRKAHSDRDRALVDRLRMELRLPHGQQGATTRTPQAGRPAGTTDQALDATRGWLEAPARRLSEVETAVKKPEAGKHE